MSLDLFLRIFVAALGGAAVGLERERSGHATGPAARFAGLRTSTLLGLLAGLAGWMGTTSLAPAGVILVLGGAALVVAGYASASRADVDGTTEAAALVVLAAGVAAGAGHITLASAVIATTTLLLAEKTRLHAIAQRIDDASLRAALRFAVMAVVVLPLLPSGPYGPFGGVRPRELWALVLFFSGLSFAGYLARRVVGPTHGHAIAGLLGGLVSSTSVAITFSRASRAEPQSGASMAAGVVGACTVVFPRVVLASAVLNPSLAWAVAPLLVAPFAAGLLGAALGLRSTSEDVAAGSAPGNPLGFWAALQMAGLFQVVLFVVYAMRTWFGNAGVLASSAVLGLTDVDALVLSMARSAASGLALDTAALALAIGALANTLLKFAVVVGVGRGRFRRLAGAGLALMAAAQGGAMLLAK
jgi:uncharacterized membrane protein (DUF4010 family)